MGKLIAVVSARAASVKRRSRAVLPVHSPKWAGRCCCSDGDFELGNIDLTLGISPPYRA
jgi:hypothetical protein